MILKKKLIYLNTTSPLEKDLAILSKYYQLCAERPNIIFYDLLSYLKLNVIWYLAFKNLTQNNGLDYVILTEVEERALIELKNQVSKGKYLWGVYIKKRVFPNTVNILGLQDKLLEEVLKILLEPIFEINFEDNSFGFRPYRTCHTAFSYIYTYMKNSLWVVQGNLHGWFDSVSAQLLVDSIGLRVQDTLILSLLKTGLEINILNGGYSVVSDLGVPIGGGLSTLLSNVYLDLLDKSVNQLCIQYVKNKIQQLKPFFNSNKYPKGSNIRYLRYGDLFIVGIEGTFDLAVEIKHKIQSYLREYLYIKYKEINLDIKHLCKGVSFLGYL